MRKSKGYRSRTRHLFKKHTRQKGIRPLDYLLRDFNEGDIVDIIVDSSEHKGMPHRRYHGKTGEITKKQGKAFIVAIKQGRATKQIIAKKEHLRLSRSVIQAGN
ncbi:MAG: 50S ribosomal protein L21e [Candidatus Heimdallarchaeota archaeon]|nr:50S ribosomal protein L21e [Candidatus Heimdallarchaeota archaeon]